MGVPVLDLLISAFHLFCSSKDADEAISWSARPISHRIPRGRILRDQNYRAQLATTLP